jgi:serine phosphatase RsbU (regulator of sigma subunit)
MPQGRHVNPPFARYEQTRLQRLLLPDVLPDIGCTEAAAAYRPANNELPIGGDWFDLVDRPESNSVVAIIGDVVGHGVEQISTMGQLRAAANALAHSIAEPVDIIAGLDRFAASTPGAHFATIAIIVFDGSNTARICCAGHPPPILVNREDPTFVIDTGRRAVLTVGSSGPSGAFQLALGDLIVMYTDGVVERRDEDFDDNISALGEFVRQRHDQPCINIATDIVDEFGRDATDDQAVLVLRPLHIEATHSDASVHAPPSVSWPTIHAPAIT